MSALRTDMTFASPPRGIPAPGGFSFVRVIVVLVAVLVDGADVFIFVGRRRPG